MSPCAHGSQRRPRLRSAPGALATKNMQARWVQLLIRNLGGPVTVLDPTLPLHFLPRA